MQRTLINIVVGNVYDTKFNHNAAVYFSKNGISSYNIQHLYDGDISGAWKVADIGRIVSTAKKNTCRAIRMTVDAKGALFDVNPVSAGTNAGLVPLKGSGALSDTSKYGGYDNATTAYFMLVRSKGKKNKKQLSFEAYPLYLEKQFNGSAQSKLSYSLILILKTSLSCRPALSMCWSSSLKIIFLNIAAKFNGR